MAARQPDPADYAATVSALAKLPDSRETSRESSVADVTGTVADVGARVASAQASIQRVRTLMNRAGNLDQVVQLESELASREAALESLQAQQRALSAQVALTTITLHVRQSPAPRRQHGGTNQLSFWVGLTAGWRTFTVVVRVLLTTLGALLPFLLSAVVVGVPVAALLRRRRLRRSVDAHRA